MSFSASNEVAYEKSRNLLYRVFGWMTFALVLTGVAAFFVASNTQLLMAIFTRPWIAYGLLFAQLGVVIAFSVLLPRLAYGTALLLFIVYALLTGVTLSIIFKAYTLSSIVQTLLITAGMFGSAALYGYITQKDLSSYGSLLRMALWGLIIALIVNIFLKSSTLGFIASFVGVLLFTALTAYDIHVIKKLAHQLEGADAQSYAKVGLYGAFILYLDFINLFLSLLNLTGRRRD